MVDRFLGVTCLMMLMAMLVEYRLTWQMMLNGVDLLYCFVLQSEHNIMKI